MVVALYPFQAIEGGDISLEKVRVLDVFPLFIFVWLFIIYLLIMLQGEEYEVVDDSQEHWWRVRDKFGYLSLNIYFVFRLISSFIYLFIIVVLDTFLRIM